jgi:hypothetical protein
LAGGRYDSDRRWDALDDQLKVKFAGAQGFLGVLESHGEIVLACSIMSRFHGHEDAPKRFNMSIILWYRSSAEDR